MGVILTLWLFAPFKNADFFPICERLQDCRKGPASGSDIMRAVRPCLLASIAACAMLIVGTVDAQSQTFRFRVCNRSDVTASVAVSAHVSPDDEQFMIKGWWTVEPGECKSIGHFPVGWFYYYAEQRGSGKIYWGGDDIRLCVKYPGPWERINTPDYSCRSSEKLKGFIARKVDWETGMHTWNLNP